MVEQAFRRIDIDGDGRLSRAKVLSACNDDDEVRSPLIASHCLSLPVGVMLSACNDDDEVRALLQFSLPHHVCSSM